MLLLPSIVIAEFVVAPYALHVCFFPHSRCWNRDQERFTLQASSKPADSDLSSASIRAHSACALLGWIANLVGRRCMVRMSKAAPADLDWLLASIVLLVVCLMAKGRRGGGDISHGTRSKMRDRRYSIRTRELPLQCNDSRAWNRYRYRPSSQRRHTGRLLRTRTPANNLIVRGWSRFHAHRNVHVHSALMMRMFGGVDQSWSDGLRPFSARTVGFPQT